MQQKFGVIIGLLIVAFLFYWFQARPSLIKKSCAGYATEKGCNGDYCSKDKYDFRYDKCLHEKGLK